MEVALGVLSRGGTELELELELDVIGSSKEITFGALSRNGLALIEEFSFSSFSSFFSSTGLSGITKGSPTLRSTGSLEAVFWASWRAITSSRSLSNVIMDSREVNSFSGRCRARAQSRIRLTSTTEKESFWWSRRERMRWSGMLGTLGLEMNGEMQVDGNEVMIVLLFQVNIWINEWVLFHLSIPT